MYVETESERDKCPPLVSAYTKNINLRAHLKKYFQFSNFPLHPPFIFNHKEKNSFIALGGKTFINKYFFGLSPYTQFSPEPCTYATQTIKKVSLSIWGGPTGAVPT